MSSQQEEPWPAVEPIVYNEALIYVSWWAEGASFLLLGLMYVALPLPPSKRLWPRFGEPYWWAFILVLNMLWNVFRYVAEGLTGVCVSRGFMDLALIYSVVWLYTLGFGWCQDVEAYKRTIEVMRDLRYLKTVRGGRSSRDEVIGQSNTLLSCGRRGENEVVIREGCSRPLWPWLFDMRTLEYMPVTSNTVQESGSHVRVEWTKIVEPRFVPLNAKADCGVEYWRGKEKRVEKHSLGDQVIWFVHIIEEEMHRDKLEPLMRPGALKDKDRPKLKLFRAIYDTVYESCRQHQSSSRLHVIPTENPNEQQSGAMWPDGRAWKPLHPEMLAKRSGCDVDDDRPGMQPQTPLGNIARKVAADGVYYVYGSNDRESRNRVGDQVRKLNEIIDQIAADQLAEWLTPNVQNKSGT